MIDYLGKYHLKENEKEKIAFAFIKQIKRGKGNADFWNSYNVLYDDNFVSNFLENMSTDGFLSAKDGRYILTERGKKVYKRGWIYHERKWYDADIIRKYSFILSVIAILLSIIGTENLRAGIIYLWQLICR